MTSPGILTTGRLAVVGHAFAYVVALALLAIPAMVLIPEEEGAAVGLSTRHLGTDFGELYRTGEAVLNGVSPYRPETLAGPFGLTVSWYVYPPPLAAAMAPLALLPPLLANVVWIVLLASSLLLAGAIIAGAGDPGRAETATAIAIGLALGFSTPATLGMSAGNFSVLLAVMALAPVLATRRHWIAGTISTIAALAKVQPIIWIPYLAGAGRLRALLVAAGTGIAILVATYALPGVRAGWADYPTVVRNAAAGGIVHLKLGGNLSISGFLELPPEVARPLDLCLLASSMVFLFLAGRYGVRFAPLAAGVGLFALPLGLHQVLVAAPVSLAVVALGPGIKLRGGRIRMSGVRLAEALAVAFLAISYACLAFGLDRFAAFLLVVPLGVAAAIVGPSSLTHATDSPPAGAGGGE